MVRESLRFLAVIAAGCGTIIQANAAPPLDPTSMQGVRDNFAAIAPKIGEALPSITIYDAEGQPFALQSLKGQYTVIVFGCLT